MLSLDSLSLLPTTSKPLRSYGNGLAINKSSSPNIWTPSWTWTLYPPIVTSRICINYDYIKSHVWSLKSLRIEAASYGTLLSPVLLATLPPDLWLIVSRKVSNSNLDMDALLATFERGINCQRESQLRNFPTKPKEVTSHGFCPVLWFSRLEGLPSLLLPSIVPSVHKLYFCDQPSWSQANPQD